MENNEKTKRIILIAKAMVFNDEGKLLMVRRDRPCHKESHNHWEMPGGKVEFGEHPSKTAERETLEESGFEVEVVKMIPHIESRVWEHPDRLSNVVVICFVCKLKGGSASTEDHGVNKVEWFDLNNLPSVDDMLPGTIEFVEAYKEGLKNEQ